MKDTEDCKEYEVDVSGLTGVARQSTPYCVPRLVYSGSARSRSATRLP